MTMKGTASDFRISPNYKDSQWKSLELDDGREKDWLTAINIVEDRVRGRFVKWIDEICPCQFSGFAVVALDCALLETLYGFFKGKSEGKTKKIYKSFLTGSLTGTGNFSLDENTAKSFYEDVRNGIIHDTETRKNWIIEQTKPAKLIVERNAAGNFVLNRSNLHTALKSEFEMWLKKLRGGDADLRRRMRARMEEIAKKHFES
jgi:hypothetical protein